MGAALEDPGRWAVIVGWDSVEAHERFVASEEGQRQRQLLQDFLTGEAEVRHFEFADLSEGLR
jgi:quinol monooxygenase YgiN